MLIKVSAKCSDMCFVQGIGEQCSTKVHDGYVPHGLGIGGGDYVNFTFDTETGKIVGFPKLSDDEVLEILTGD